MLSVIPRIVSYTLLFVSVSFFLMRQPRQDMPAFQTTDLYLMGFMSVVLSYQSADVYTNIQVSAFNA
jgi:hypothetical protein